MSRRVASLTASLVVHGASVLAAFLLFAGESGPAVFFVDLTRELVEPARGPAPAGASGAPAPRPAGLPAREPRRVAVQSARPAPPLHEPQRISSAAVPAAVVSEAPAPASSEPVTGPAVPPAPGRAVPDGPLAGGGGNEEGGREGRVSDAGGGLGLGPSAMTGRGGDGGGAASGAGRSALAAAAPTPAVAPIDYSAYLGEVRRRIQEALRYPLAARRRSLAGTVQIEITIGRDGAIGGVSVAVSSTHAMLDDAAVEAVRGLAPVPFPAGTVARPLRVRLPVVFELQ